MLRSRARALLRGRAASPWTVLLVGGIAAGAAWIHVFAGWTDELFGRFAARDSVAGLTRLHWPLVNPNHLAALVNLSWPIALGALLWPPLLVPDDRTALAAGIARALAGIVLVLTLSALLATESRGGFLAAGLPRVPSPFRILPAPPRRVRRMGL